MFIIVNPGVFSDEALLVLPARSDARAMETGIGPALIFQRLSKELGLHEIFRKLFLDRKLVFDVERAVFLTVIQRLFVSRSDRCRGKWREDYRAVPREK
ncbi:MAG TPA: hypothetical protein PL090_03225 [Syntrophales bacterium]|nr:hypothetical protein [Syntrophales bacterium]